MNSLKPVNTCIAPLPLIQEKIKSLVKNGKDTCAVEKTKPKVSISTKGGRWLASRYICVLLGFLSCIVMTSQRLNLSMALMAMANHPTVMTHANMTAHHDDCPLDMVANSTTPQRPGGDLDWDSQVQSQILSGSFFGFMLSQIPGGRLSEILGAKQILIFSLGLASFCNFLSPLAAVSGAYYLMAAQFVKGLAQGMTHPALTCLMSRWYPNPEKGFLSSLTFAGYPGGCIVGGLIIGVLCDSDFLGGWPLVFYFFGFLGLFLCVACYCLIFNNPIDDPRITEAEYKYICSNTEFKDSTKTSKTPWIAILTSIPTWALFVGMFGQYWMTFYFLSVHPTYLGTVLHFTHTESGYLNSLPFIGQILTTSAASFFSDVLVNRGMATVDTVRKVCNMLSCIGFSFGLLGVTYAACDRTLNIVFFVIAISCVGFGYPGANIVALDMTTNYAGTLMGIISTLSSSSACIIPLIVGALTNTEQTLGQWAIACYICAGVGIGSGVIFQMFGSAKIQKWDHPTPPR